MDHDPMTAGCNQNSKPTRRSAQPSVAQTTKQRQAAKCRQGRTTNLWFRLRCLNTLPQTRRG
eukprot:356690-Chlamydomonas_euryale.AAC.11